MPAQGGQNTSIPLFSAAFPKSIFHVKIKRMKKLFFGICLLGWAFTLQAQSVFKGKVFQSDSVTAVSGATVEIQHLGSAITNEKGEFSFSRVAPGNYSVKVS